MKKTYDFDYDLRSASVKFEVDTEKFTNELAQATLDFFTWDADYDHDADPIDEVMKKYALEAIREATFNGHNAYGVKKDFEEKEGYARIDGTMGITLISVDGYEFDEDLLEVEIS